MYEIRFHIIEEILSHAFNYFPKIEADPLENEVLSQLGHPQLNFHIEKLNEIDTEKTVPLTSIINASLRSRKDEVSNEKIRDQILKNSPEKNEEFFVVPKVID